MVVRDVLEGIMFLAVMLLVLGCFGKTWEMIAQLHGWQKAAEAAPLSPLPRREERFLVDHFTPSSGPFLAELDEDGRIYVKILEVFGYVEEGQIVAYPTERGKEWLAQHGKS